MTTADVKLNVSSDDKQFVITNVITMSTAMIDNMKMSVITLVVDGICDEKLRL